MKVHDTSFGAISISKALPTFGGNISKKNNKICYFRGDFYEIKLIVTYILQCFLYFS